MEYIRYNQQKYKEQLELRYNLFLANKIQQVITFFIIAAVIVIDCLRVMCS